MRIRPSQDTVGLTHLTLFRNQFLSPPLRTAVYDDRAAKVGAVRVLCASGVGRGQYGIGTGADPAEGGHVSDVHGNEK